MDLIHKVKKTIEKARLIEDGDNILIGLSGGIDSTALLYVLAEIAQRDRFKIGIAHINHLLRGEESHRDQQFVETLARRFSLPCYVKRLDVRAYAKERGISLQHAGRDVRYNFFHEISLEHAYDKIAVAHNLDDRVETFILRMLKGSGIRGLASIPIKRDRIIRPFLNIYRSEIEEYVNASSISHVEDSSNSKIVYERNYVRKEIMPLMKRLNPAFKEKIFLLLHDITNINNFFEERAVRFIESHLKPEAQDISFEIKALDELDAETRFRIIANTLDQLEPGFIALREHHRLVDKILRGSRPNLAITLPHGIKVKRIYDRLIFTNKQTRPVIEDVFPIKSGENRLEPFKLILDIKLLEVDDNPLFAKKGQEGIFALDGNIAFFDADKIGDLCVRTFKEGDRFSPLGMNNYVKLKDFFISRKIPKEQRRQIPLLISNNDIIWIIGHRIDERYKVTERTKRVMRVVVKLL